MTYVDALYQNGVFKPLQEVDLHENQRVQLSAQPIQPDDIKAWLERIEERHQRIIAERLPSG